MAVKRRDACGFHSGGTSTGNDDVQRKLTTPDVGLRQFTFAAHGRVDRAAHPFATYQPADTALIARDAGSDLMGPALPGFLHQVCVGDGGADQRDQIGLAGMNDSCRLPEGAKSSRHDSRYGGDRADLRGRCQLVSGRVMHPAHDVVRLEMVAIGEIHIVDELLALQKLQCPLTVSSSNCDVRSGAETHPDGEARRNGAAHCPRDLEQEPAPVFEGSAVLILAIVVIRREKLLNDVAMRTLYLNSIELTLLCALGGRGERLHQLIYLTLPHGATHNSPGPRDVGNGPRRAAVCGGADISSMKQLLEDPHIVRAQRFHQAS